MESLIIRNIPHIEGNYQTFISIPISYSLKYDSLIKEVLNYLTLSNQSNTIEKIDKSNFHISLLKSSKFLKSIEIENFIIEIKNNLSAFKKFQIGITNQVKFLSNDYLNRFFICLLVMKNKNLLNLYKVIQDLLKKFNLEESEDIFSIKDFLFHVSILSSVNNDFGITEEELNKKISNKSTKIIKLVSVEYISLTIGKRDYLIKLKD